MRDQYTRKKFMWLTVGTLAGICVSYFWPHEPAAYAITTDRAEEFMVFTAPVGVLTEAEAVFVLDFLTGQLRGAVLNNKVGKFTNFYQRNISADFGVDDPSTEPHYAVVAGAANLPSRGRFTTASGVIYIAEVNSGICICYAFEYRESTTNVPTFELAKADVFQWREGL